jgi:hypothetical protein
MHILDKVLFLNQYNICPILDYFEILIRYIFIYDMCFFQQTISYMRKRFTEWVCVGHQRSYEHIHNICPILDYFEILIRYIKLRI